MLMSHQDEAMKQVSYLSYQQQINRLEQRVAALEKPSYQAERIPAASAQSNRSQHLFCSHAPTPEGDARCERDEVAARSPEAEGDFWHDRWEKAEADLAAARAALAEEREVNDRIQPVLASWHDRAEAAEAEVAALRAHIEAALGEPRNDETSSITKGE